MLAARSIATPGEQVLRDGKDIGQLQLDMRSGGQQATFGRAPGCEVVLEHASISRQHATLALDHACNLTVVDLNSGAKLCRHWLLLLAAGARSEVPACAAHGTNVDGLWLRANTPKHLQLGSTIQLGGSSRKYVVRSCALHTRSSSQVSC